MKILVKEKVLQVLLIYSAIFIPMWLAFAIGQILPIEIWFGIKPREFEFLQVIAIMFSWLPHYNLPHIMNNSVMLLGLLLPVILIEKNNSKIIISLIALSGFFTWLLGGNHTLHFGASGLVFALFSYICSSVLINRKFMYLIPIIISSLYYGLTYFTSFFHGLIPNDFVSFAAHFGGLLSGIIICGYQKLYLNKKEKGQ